MCGRRGSLTGATISSPRNSVAPLSVTCTVYGERSTNDACQGTVSGSPRTHRKSASDGPAPPRRPQPDPGPSDVAPTRSSLTLTPSDCSSTSSWRSSRAGSLRALSATAGKQLLVVLPEHPILELLGDVPDAVDLPVLAVEVRPRLVGAEEHAVAADARALDLGQQPPCPEPDRPRGIGVDLVTVPDPLEELRHELDVAGDATPEVDEVDLAPLSVRLDQRNEVVDVRVTAGTGVEVKDEVVLLAHVEAFVGQRASLVIPRVRVRITTEQE